MKDHLIPRWLSVIAICGNSLNPKPVEIMRAKLRCSPVDGLPVPYLNKCSSAWRFGVEQFGRWCGYSKVLVLTISRKKIF